MNARGKARLGEIGKSKDSTLESERAGELKSVTSSEAERLRLRAIVSISEAFEGEYVRMLFARVAEVVHCGAMTVKMD